MSEYTAKTCKAYRTTPMFSHTRFHRETLSLIEQRVNHLKKKKGTPEVTKDQAFWIHDLNT